MPSPSLAILNFDFGRFLACFRALVLYILLAARFNITSYWKKDFDPNLTEIMELDKLYIIQFSLISLSNGILKQHASNN